jgi:hypothetical protein
LCLTRSVSRERSRRQLASAATEIIWGFQQFAWNVIHHG